MGNHDTWNTWIERLLEIMKRVASVGVKRKEKLADTTFGVKTKLRWARDIKIAGGEKPK